MLIHIATSMKCRVHTNGMPCLYVHVEIKLDTINLNGLITYYRVTVSYWWLNRTIWPILVASNWCQECSAKCSLFCLEHQTSSSDLSRIQSIFLEVKHCFIVYHRLIDNLVVEGWHRVREVPGSIPTQGPRHTKDIIKIVPVVPLFST